MLVLPEETMATTDAEMPDHKALREDLQEIAARLANLRSDIDGLMGAAGATASHQAEALQDQASEALANFEDAVRREPLKSLAIAAGAGFVLGILLRR
ncbi:hypothetical protein AUC71_12270 [Methyloceanibacter marginalis]|uniref:DUF883 domain-containing protein n=2 Tax=Methyloceanibacter marginalis TaxID=1774971 RepID=A0A1E3WB10_9HYPH|nr:hypothetical protein AUC71_12270 [Methyloceanibacter marginalis]